MNEIAPEPEIEFSLLHDEAEWDRLVEELRGRWSQITDPLRAVEADFVDLQRQLLGENPPGDDAWDVLLQNFGEWQARDKGLRSYLETADVASALFTSPAGSLGWRDAAAVRLKLDQDLSALTQEPMSSTELRESLLGLAARVASGADFYQNVRVKRDRQRQRLGMEKTVPHYYLKTEASPGAEQPRGAEPGVVWKLRILAEWRLRRQCIAWEVWKGRRGFWMDGEAELRDFLDALFPPPPPRVSDFDAAPARQVPVEDTRSRWAKIKDWTWNATIGLVFPSRRRRRQIYRVIPAEKRILPEIEPAPPSHSVKMLKVPARQFWPILIGWHKDCEGDAERLDQAGRDQDMRIRGLQGRMSGMEAVKDGLERGVDVPAIRADTTTRDLRKEAKARREKIEGLSEFIFKLS